MADSYEELRRLFSPLLTTAPDSARTYSPSDISRFAPGNTGYNPPVFKGYGSGLNAQQYAEQQGLQPSGGGDSNQSWLEAIGGGLKDVGVKALEIADIPGAIVRSGIKEIADTIVTSGLGKTLISGIAAPFVEGGKDEAYRRLTEWGRQHGTTGSWQDFVDQAKQHQGMQQLVLQNPEYAGMKKGIGRSALGMGLDLLFDPTLYLSAGATVGAKAIKEGAEAFADDALRVAVNSGSSKMISKRVATLATEAADRGAVGFERAANGMFTNDAVNRLLAETRMRGRGALTQKGLERAGIDAGMAAELGIGRMEKTVFGMRIPHTERLADATENLKGSIFKWGRDLGFSKSMRNKFIAEIGGQRDLTRILMDESVALNKRGMAGVALTTANNALKEGRAWGKAALDMVREGFHQAGWHKLSQEARIVATHELEAGVDNALTAAARTQLETLRKQAIQLGVDIADLPNYVPHQVRDEVYDLMKKNAEMKDVITKHFKSKEGFERTRELVAGSEFMGETLQTGSIDEINRIFRDKFNVNLFEEDLSRIMPEYIAQMQRAVIRESQIKQLTDLGLVSSRGVKKIKELNDDPEFLKELRAAETDLKAAQDKTVYNLRDGTKIRHDEAVRLKPVLKQERDKVVAKIAKVEQHLKDLARKRFKAEQAVKDIDAEIVLMQEMITQQKAIIKSQRKTLRKDAEQQLVKFEKRLAEKQAEKQALVDTIQGIMKGKEPIRFRTERTRPLVQQEAMLRADLDTMNQTRDMIQSRVDELQEHVPPGQGGAPADLIHQHYTDRVDDLLVAKPKAVEQVQAATQVYAFAEADSRSVLAYLNKLKDDLEEAYRLASKNMPTGVKKQTIVNARNEMRDRLNTIHAIFARTGNTVEERLIAGVEAAAAVADMNAWRAGNAEKQLFDALDVLKSKEFVESEVIQDAGKHMVAMGERNQMPEWLFDATKIPFATSGLPMFGKWGKKFYNLFKGYAILRPGFHVRNAYSAMYNMYLEAGAKSFGSVKEFSDYYKMTRKIADPIKLKAAAEAKFGKDTARMLNDAWASAMGTGSGQIAGEFSSGGLRTVSAKPWGEDSFLSAGARAEGSLNPFKESFVALRKSREVGEFVEDLVRGAHAYDVLKRGGNTDQAIDILNKWHFNYTDITSFDQGMKLINPFWIFWSRNLALQATTFTRVAGKMNRTLMNFQRNMGYGLPEDQYVPEYFKKAGAIRVSNQGYWFPELPQMQAWQEFQNLTNPSDWKKVLANTAPWIKGPIEIATDMNLYTGMSTENKFAPLFGPLGGPVMEQRYASAVSGAIPGLGQVKRLMPEGDGNTGQAWLSYLLGISGRTTNERTRTGEILRQQDEAYKAALKRAAQQAAG